MYLGSLAVLGNLIYNSGEGGNDFRDYFGGKPCNNLQLSSMWHPQAHEQGARETTRENILEILAIRLQPDAAETFKPTLEAIDDLQRLKQLHRAAILAETPEDFTQALNENDN